MPRDATAAAPAHDVAGAVHDLEADGLAIAYRGGEAILRDICFRVGRGERVALIGPNGAGKTSLLLALLRLVEPERGSVRIFGKRLDGLSRRRLRRLRSEVGFVFQGHNLVPRLGALSNVVHGALGRAGGVSAWSQALAPAALRAEAMDCLDRVGLADLAARRVDRLSGGQSQRVAIARALMQRPRLMLADEPAASLDPQAGADVMEMLAGLACESGIGLLFTSHNIAHARAYATRVVALRAGGIAFDCPAGAIDDAALGALYG